MPAPFDRRQFVEKMLEVGFTEQQANALVDVQVQFARRLRGEAHIDDVEAGAEAQRVVTEPETDAAPRETEAARRD